MPAHTYYGLRPPYVGWQRAASPPLDPSSIHAAPSLSHHHPQPPFHRAGVGRRGEETRWPRLFGGGQGAPSRGRNPRAEGGAETCREDRAPPHDRGRGRKEPTAQLDREQPQPTRQAREHQARCRLSLVGFGEPGARSQEDRGMIAKFFPKGRAGLDYVLGKGRKVDEREPLVMAGEPAKVRALIHGSDFANPYTSAVLTYDREITEEEMRRDMESFDRMILPGMTPGVEYERVWVRHREHPKDPVTRNPDPTRPLRTALHWVCANTELSTGKRLQPYYDRVDRKRVEAWQELTNIDHGYASPKDPERRRAATFHANRLPGTVRELKEQLLGAVVANLAAEQLNTRAELMTWLETQGFGIQRVTDRAISISHPTLKKNLRLEGELYELNGLEDAARARDAGQKPERRVSQDSSAQYRRQLSESVERKRRELSERFARRDEEGPRVLGGVGQSGTPALGGEQHQGDGRTRADQAEAVDVGTSGATGDRAGHGRGNDLGDDFQRAESDGARVLGTPTIRGDESRGTTQPGRNGKGTDRDGKDRTPEDPRSDRGGAPEIGGSGSQAVGSYDVPRQGARNGVRADPKRSSDFRVSGADLDPGRHPTPIPVNHDELLPDGGSLAHLLAGIRERTRAAAKRLGDAIAAAQRAVQSRLRFGKLCLEALAGAARHTGLATERVDHAARELGAIVEAAGRGLLAGSRSLQFDARPVPELSRGGQSLALGSWATAAVGRRLKERRQEREQQQHWRGFGR